MDHYTDATLSLDEYQILATKTAIYPGVGKNIVYPALGVAGEAGEVAEKVKKLWRNKDTMAASGATEVEAEAIVKEMGDCLWYLAAICNEMNITLSHVADVNLKKLKDRRERGVIKSEGDNR